MRTPPPLLALVAFGAAACVTGPEIVQSDRTVDTTAALPVLSRLAGDGQTGTVGTALPAALEVAVLDSAGHGVPGVAVQFAVVGPNGNLSPASGSVRTGADGHAGVTLTLGRHAGTVRVVAAGTGALGSADFAFLAVPSTALTVVPVSGDSQLVALPGSVPDRFVVAVRDTFGNAVSGHAVTFTVTAGRSAFGGSPSFTASSDTGGTASATLDGPAPADGDTVRVSVTAAGVVTPPAHLVVAGVGFRGPAWDFTYASVCAVATTGQGYCWGANANGQLGNGGTSNVGAPTPVTGGSGLAAVAAGSYGSCALASSGVASCWGSSSFPNQFSLAPPLRALSVGYSTACGVTGSGGVTCWPSGALTASEPPRFVDVSTNNGATCALDQGGTAYCWGYNTYGQLGIGSTSPTVNSPTPVVGGLTFRSISLGPWHSCGVTTSGHAYCWGSNAHGELGSGDTTERRVPTLVAGGIAFTQVSAGYYHTCGVAVGGAAYCWGSDDWGQLGDGTLGDTLVTVPVAVTGGIAFASVQAGGASSCGIAVDGAAWCWGSNSSGELGIGTIGGASAVPVAVTGGLLFLP